MSTTYPVPFEVAPVGERPPTIENQQLVRLYRDMVRIRIFEEEVVDAFRAGLIPGSTHPCIGQEAIKVGALDAIGQQDMVLATYRGHAEALLRGIDPV
jgi:TPP-dependent pyruvate/acetoin dehydrogenase alpha subunit